MIYPILFVVTFFSIGLRAFQQRNVAYDKTLYVVPTSLCISLVEVVAVTTIVTAGVNAYTVAAYGFGAGFGSLAFMWLHKRVTRCKKT